MFCQGPVSAIAVEPGGNQMVTAGVDGQVCHPPRHSCVFAEKTLPMYGCMEFTQLYEGIQVYKHA